MPHENTAQLYCQLDVSQSPPRVVEVNIGMNMDTSNKPGIAILTWVTGRTIAEAHSALHGLIKSDPKFAWVREWPNIQHSLDTWEGR